LYLKHLLRGVKLGLFDEATAMTKFAKWHEEHETKLKQKGEEHRRSSQRARRPQVPVKRVQRDDQPAEGSAEA
jgi:small subunit ribosomal protein S16